MFAFLSSLLGSYTMPLEPPACLKSRICDNYLFSCRYYLSTPLCVESPFSGPIYYSKRNYQELESSKKSRFSFHWTVVEYLGTELGWSDYLVPQISNFVDDEGATTLSYGILFIFTPYQMTFTKALVAIATTLLGIGGLVTWLCLK